MPVPLKVLHLCGSRVGGGGAGIACDRLNAALVKYGINSSIWGETLSNVKSQRGSFKEKLWLMLFQPAFRQTTTLGLRSQKNIIKSINESDCDILHLHIPNYAISIQDIPKIQKKIVWTIHDSWLFCGTEVYPTDCRFIDGYRRNNQTLKRCFDIDRLIWLWKKHCWKDLDFTFVAPSSWEAEQFRSSKLFRNKACEVIPNCIDQSIFHVRDKQEVRRILSLPEDKLIILFGANSASRPVKGLDLLLDALKKIPRDPNLLLVCFGCIDDPSVFSSLEIPYLCTNAIFEQDKIAMFYSAADVFVCPSRMDNLPNTCIESISCGTPVAAFDVGGIPEIITHNENGYLAKPYDTTELANGIQFCMSIRGKIQSSYPQYSEKYVSGKYIELYQKIMEK